MPAGPAQWNMHRRLEFWPLLTPQQMTKLVDSHTHCGFNSAKQVHFSEDAMNKYRKFRTLQDDHNKRQRGTIIISYILPDICDRG